MIKVYETNIRGLDYIFRKDNLTLIWIDAHPDINTYKASISKNRHGMPVAMCVGLDKPWWNVSNKLNFENIFDTICQAVNLTNKVTVETIRQNHKNFLLAQRYLDSQLKCEQWAKSIIEGKALGKLPVLTKVQLIFLPHLYVL